MSGRRCVDHDEILLRPQPFRAERRSDSKARLAGANDDRAPARKTGRHHSAVLSACVMASSRSFHCCSSSGSPSTKNVGVLETPSA